MRFPDVREEVCEGRRGEGGTGGDASLGWVSDGEVRGVMGAYAGRDDLEEREVGAGSEGSSEDGWEEKEEGE